MYAAVYTGECARATAGQHANSASSSSRRKSLTRVRHNTQQKINITLHDGETVFSMPVSKGALTVANAEHNSCELCECDTHLMLHSVCEQGTRRVSIIARDTQQEMATLQLDGLWSTLTTTPGVHVTGVRQLVQHMAKKHLRLPRGDMGAVVAIQPYTSLPEARQHILDMALLDVLAPDDAPRPAVAADATLARVAEPMYLHNAFTEIFHFNSKLISRISTAYAYMDLAQCRGVCLNACVLHQSLSVEDPVDAQHESIVLAHTMQRVQLPTALVRGLRALAAAPSVVCKLKYMNADRALDYADVAAVDTASLAELDLHGLTRPAPACEHTYVCVAACGTPIIFGDMAFNSPLANAPTQSAASKWQHTCSRLLYIQAVCNHHRLSHAELRTWTKQWAATALEAHPDRSEHVSAMSKIMSPAICAHTVIAHY